MTLTGPAVDGLVARRGAAHDGDGRDALLAAEDVVHRALQRRRARCRRSRRRWRRRRASSSRAAASRSRIIARHASGCERVVVLGEAAARVERRVEVDAAEPAGEARRAPGAVIASRFSRVDDRVPAARDRRTTARGRARSRAARAPRPRRRRPTADRAGRRTPSPLELRASLTPTGTGAIGPCSQGSTSCLQLASAPSPARMLANPHWRRLTNVSSRGMRTGAGRLRQSLVGLEDELPSAADEERDASRARTPWCSLKDPSTTTAARVRASCTRCRAPKLSLVVGVVAEHLDAGA